MLNLEKLAFQLLTRVAPAGVTIIPDIDVDTLDDFPVVTFSVTGGQALDTSGGAPSSWACGLSLSVFTTDLDEGIDLAATFYDGIHGWADPWTQAGRVVDLGHVSEVEDQALFTRAGTVAIDHRAVTQMVGDFTLQMHQA